MTTLLTVGHGTADQQALSALLTGAGIEVLVDVRRFPGSRRHPDVGQDALERWLPNISIEYAWEQGLGGRRRLPAGEPVVDTWWTVEAFRAYAAYTRTPAFIDAMSRVLAQAESGRTAVMCSESVWWRCHRRLIADVAMLGHKLDVQHVMPGGRMSAHRPAEAARVRGDGLLVWDGV